MKIGADLDNTVGRYLEVFCQHAKEELGVKIYVEDMTAPDVRFESTGLLTQDQVKYLKTLDQERKTFSKMPIYEDAQQVLPKLCQEHELYFVSCRDNYEPSQLLEHTRQWLGKYGIEGYKEIFFTKNKAQTIRPLALDYFVEDNFGEAVAVQDCVKVVFLINRPWNAKLKLPNQIERVQSWYELGEKLVPERQRC